MRVVERKMPLQRCEKQVIVEAASLSKIMKSSYLTKVSTRTKAIMVEKDVGAFSDYFIFIVFPLQGPEYVMCIMPALSAAL